MGNRPDRGGRDDRLFWALIPGRASSIRQGIAMHHDLCHISRSTPISQRLSRAAIWGIEALIVRDETVVIRLRLRRVWGVVSREAAPLSRGIVIGPRQHSTTQARDDSNMIWQVGLYAAAVLIPLVAFAIEAIFIRQLKRFNAYLATGAIGLSCVLSLIGFLDYTIESKFYAHAAEHSESTAEHGETAGHGEAAESQTHHQPLVWSSSFDWVVLGETGSGPGLAVPLGIAVDNLSAVMFLMVTFIATLIHIYSMGYMHDDPRYPRFFTYLSLFCFSMLGLVASSNVFMIFVFWELVGVCSYLLIGFWYEEKVNSDAANKAFVVNRVGDVGMLVGLGLLWTSLGTFSFQEINQGLRGPTGNLHEVRALERCQSRRVGRSRDPQGHAQRSDPRAAADSVLDVDPGGPGDFCRLRGQKRQFPLHVWLPDAMAGPTPVSALIHAATMVAAGVYLVGRFFPVFTAGCASFHRLHRRDHVVHRCDDRDGPDRLQEGARVFDGQSAWLHDAGPGRRWLGGGAVPPADSCLLQGDFVPGRRQRLPQCSHLRDASAGRSAQEDADHGLDDAGRAHWRSRAFRSSAAFTRKTRFWRPRWRGS